MRSASGSMTAQRPRPKAALTIAQRGRIHRWTVGAREPARVFLTASKTTIPHAAAHPAPIPGVIRGGTRHAKAISRALRIRRFMRRWWLREAACRNCDALWPKGSLGGLQRQGTYRSLNGSAIKRSIPSTGYRTGLAELLQAGRCDMWRTRL